MFKVGELVKRKTVSNKPKSYCVVVDKQGDNYVLYNNALKCLQTVACLVVNELYDNVNNSIEKEVVYQMT